MVTKPTISVDFTGMNLNTMIFDDVINNNNIEELCNIINESVPTQFSSLSDCGLFSNGLNNISSNVSAILENVKSLKAQIRVHSENVVNMENNSNNRISQLPNVSVTDALLYVPGIATSQSNSLSENNYDNSVDVDNKESVIQTSNEVINDVVSSENFGVAGIATSGAVIGGSNNFVDKTPSSTQQSNRLDEIKTAFNDPEKVKTETIEQTGEVSNEVTDDTVSFGVTDKTPSSTQQSNRLDEIKTAFSNPEKVKTETIEQTGEVSNNTSIANSNNTDSEFDNTTSDIGITDEKTNDDSTINISTSIIADSTPVVDINEEPFSASDNVYVEENVTTKIDINRTNNEFDNPSNNISDEYNNSVNESFVTHPTVDFGPSNFSSNNDFTEQAPSQEIYNSESSNEQNSAIENIQIPTDNFDVQVDHVIEELPDKPADKNDYVNVYQPGVAIPGGYNQTIVPETDISNVDEIIDDSELCEADNGIIDDTVTVENNESDQNVILKEDIPETIIDNSNEVSKNESVSDDSELFRNILVGGLGAATAGVGFKVAHNKEKGEKDENRSKL